MVKYTKGHDAISNTGAPLEDEDEIAITADFRPQKGLLEGLWLRVRYAESNRGRNADDRRDLRFILSFDLDAFQ